MSGWDAVIPKISDDERKKVVEEVASQLNDMSSRRDARRPRKTRSARGADGVLGYWAIRFAGVS